LGIGDWGLGPIPNPQSPIPYLIIINILLTYLSQLYIRVNKYLKLIKLN